MLGTTHAMIDVMSAVIGSIGMSIDPETIDMNVIGGMIIEARTGTSGGPPNLKRPFDITHESNHQSRRRRKRL